ncbi:uncharacterized protein LOC113325170 [Papaver somniferum]|uniref:uncharacterized protein LOC113325170 n=1 Tax=Papaver somniferum TaxID=3469 RepID=UPI000E6F4C82|nr:uncharacterized protein LOC113325170 [Papaver somniferum]
MCFELVGYPDWWDQHLERKMEIKKNYGAPMASTKKGKDSMVISTSVARTGNNGKFLNVSSLVSNNSWIVDSGATYHMKCDYKQISSLKPSLQKTVSTANGSQAPITGEGSISLTETLNLDSVLVVHTLDCNLLSVTQITNTLHCIVIFWPDCCVFKDITMKQTIGCGVKHGRLYYLDLVSSSSDKLRQTLLADVCELSKNHRASFPLSFNKSPVPFMIIHSDVWEPSKTTTLGGSRWFVTFIDDCTRMTWNGVAERKNRHLLEVVSASLIKAHMPLMYWGEALTSAAYLINRVPSSTIVFQTPHQALAEAVVAPTVPNLPPHVFGCVAYVHLHKNQRDKLAPRALKCVFVGYATTKKEYYCYHPPTKRMFVTLDVVFHEDTIYFSCEFELQGEYQKEIQTLNYDEDISEIDVSVIVNSDDMVRESVDESSSREETESTVLDRDIEIQDEVMIEEIPESTLPQEDEAQNQSSATDVLEESRRQLPQRVNRGIPKPSYEPEISSKVKYPMSHYVSHHCLSKANKAFVNQLSTVFIPNNVQEALADPKWRETIEEEMRSLFQNDTWDYVDCPEGRKIVGVIGFSPLNTRKMVKLNVIKQD